MRAPDTAADTDHRHRDGVVRVAPLAAAVLLFGVSYGVLSHTAGFGSLQTLVFSATTFAGSAQFATASVTDAGGTAAAAILAALMLNLRYLPIGISVAPALHGRWYERLARAQLVVDEVWAVSRVGDAYHRRLLLGAGVTLYAAWLGGTLLGVLGGGLIGDPSSLGLDAAFPALFLALLAGQVPDRRSRIAAVGGGAIALCLVPFVPPGVPVVAAGAMCLLGLRPPAGAREEDG